MSSNPFDQQKPIPGIKHIIAVSSGKGGVGKSTLAANLSMACSKKLKVGLLDADIYGPSIPRLFGISDQSPSANEKGEIFPIEKNGIKIMSMGFLIPEGSAVIWRGPMLFKAMDQFLRNVVWGDLDLLIIDLPPGTGDVQLSLAQKVPLSGALAISTPQNLALIDVKKAIDMWEQIEVPILGVIENMAYLKASGQEKIQLFPQGDLDSYLESKKIKKLCSLPFQPQIAQASEQGQPFMVSGNPDSEEFQLFTQLAEIVIKTLPWGGDVF